MTSPGWLRLTGIVLATLALLLVEVLFLPLRLDGTALPDVHSFPLPVTIVLPLLTMPWLTRAAARVAPILPVAGAPLIVWLLGFGVLAAGGPGGDVVVLGDVRTVALLAAGTLPAAIALGKVLGTAAVERGKAKTDG